MASTIKQRLKRFNGTDYDTIHLENHANNVLVDVSFANPLNTDQLTLGQHDVCFTAYPDLKWCVDHLDGDYVYLGLYNASEMTAFGPNTTTAYSGSTLAAKCTTFLNNTIPNVANYLENVTVEGVTNKVFIPTYYQFSGNTGYGDTSGPIFAYPSASVSNRIACVSNWSTIGSAFWLSSPSSASYVWNSNFDGGFGGNNYPTYSRGFRPEVKVRYKNFSGAVETDTLDHVLESLKTSVSDGKGLIASAITDKGVSTSSTATFDAMASNIRAIPSGLDLLNLNRITGDYVDFNKLISLNISTGYFISVTLSSTGSAGGSYMIGIDNRWFWFGLGYNNTPCESSFYVTNDQIIITVVSSAVNRSICEYSTYTLNRTNYQPTGTLIQSWNSVSVAIQTTNHTMIIHQYGNSTTCRYTIYG